MRFLQHAWRNGAVLFSVLMFIACGGGGNQSAVENSNCAKQWQEYANNPIINFGQTIDNSIWNDPSVLKENGGYSMWLTGGTGLGINFVKVYKATSQDGLVWNIDSSVLLGPPSSNPVLLVSGTVSPNISGGEFVLINEDIPIYQRTAPAVGNEWYVWQYTSGTPSENGYYITDIPAGFGSFIWKCTENDASYPECPLGTYEPVNGATGNITLSEKTPAFDSEKTETPSVVKAGQTYHMYYSAKQIGDGPGRYTIGHATSSAGITWVKDAAVNPVISYHNDPGKWGFYQAAEPGAVYDSQTGTFFLYYVTARSRSGYTGDLALQQGIALATSNDGSNFVPYDSDSDGELDPVLAQTSHYPVTGNYVGYSTPFAFIDNEGIFHLFYDVAMYPASGDWRQVALAHATSSDGYSFTEVEQDIYVYNTGDWKNHEVRSPSVLEEGGIFKMWFAGNNELFFQSGFQIGIGYATYGENCNQ